jgi:hypothetical protein
VLFGVRSSLKGVFLVSDNNEFDNENGNDGGALRKQLEAALAKLKEKDAKLADFEARERTRTVESALSERGLNPKLAKFVPADAATDLAQLDAWIKDNSDLFVPAASNSGPGESGGTSAVPEGEQAAWRQIQAASANGSQPVTDLSAAVTQMKGVKNDSELNALLSQYGLA